MSSPYDKFKARQQEKWTLRPIHTLTKGKVYTLVKVDKAKSQFEKQGQSVWNLRVYYQDCGLRFFSYMPSDFNNPDDESVKDLEKDCMYDKPPAVCFYGRMSQTYVVKLMQHGETVDNDLLATLVAMEEAMSPLKRPPSSSESNEEPANKKLNFSN